MQDGLSTKQENRLVWAPDVFGSTAFLISGALAYRVATGPHLLPARRDRDWSMAAVNLAGCVFFGISAVASYVVPSSGSMLDLAAANWTTALGAACFFAGALMLLPQRHAEARVPLWPRRLQGGLTCHENAPPRRTPPTPRSC